MPPWDVPQGKESRDLSGYGSPVFTAESLPTVRRRKQPRSSGKDGRMNRVVHPCSGIGSGLKKRAGHSNTRCSMRNLEDAALSDTSQPQKGNVWFHLHEVSKVVKFTITERRMAVARC